MKLPLSSYCVPASPSTPKMLPQLLLIGARSRRLVLCRVKNDPVNNSYEFAVMDQPDTYRVHTDGEEGEEQGILCKRVSTRNEAPAYYESVIKRTQNHIDIDGDKIYEYTLKYPNRILPSKYYRVFMGKDDERRWHFVAPSAATATPKIPPHVLKAYIESEIAKGAECPITMMPLTASCISTPCGHLFSKGSLEGLSACPTCRAYILDI